MNTNDVSEILDKVNSFYSNSFLILVTYTAALLAFLGTIVPAVIQFYQNRKLKFEKNALLKEMESRIQKKEREFLKFAELKADEAVKNMETKLKKTAARLDGAICFQQGKILNQQGHFAMSVLSFIYGSVNFLDAEDEFNLRQIIGDLILTLPKLTKADIMKCHFDNVDIQFNELLEKIKSQNKNKQFDDVILQLKNSMDQVK
jgi:hypothetical protein